MPAKTTTGKRSPGARAQGPYEPDAVPRESQIDQRKADGHLDVCRGFLRRGFAVGRDVSMTRVGQGRREPVADVGAAMGDENRLVACHSFFGGLRPREPPNALTRGAPLIPTPFARARSRSLARVASRASPPRTPQRAHLWGPVYAVRAARSRSLARVASPPRTPPTRSLVGPRSSPRRSRVLARVRSLASLRGLRPREPPNALTRGAPLIPTPFARARSRSLARVASRASPPRPPTRSLVGPR